MRWCYVRHFYSIRPDSHHPRVFLRKPRILALNDNPRIAQTNLVCRAESASFARIDTSFLHTFVWSSQASALFPVAKAAAYRSRLQVCVREFREERRRGSLFRDAQLRSSNTLRESKPGTTRSCLHCKTSASWKSGENVENRYTWARFAQNIPCDQRICAAELGSEVCARKS